jgi:hypothetical protein
MTTCFRQHEAAAKLREQRRLRIAFSRSTHEKCGKSGFWALARKIEFVELIQRDSTSPVLSEKIFRFALTPNQIYIHGRPAPPRGALRDRHGRWRRDAMDPGRRALLARTSGAVGDGEVVWSRRSEAGAKSATMLTRLADDGGNQAMVTKESTK